MDWTNVNAAKKRTENPEKHKGKWTDTTIEEIRAFVASWLSWIRWFMFRDLNVIFSHASHQNGMLVPQEYHRFLIETVIINWKRYIHFSDPHIQLPDRRDPLYDKLQN